MTFVIVGNWFFGMVCERTRNNGDNVNSFVTDERLPISCKLIVLELDCESRKFL